MFGRRRILLWTLACLSAGIARRRADLVARGDDRRAHDAGPRRRDLPARVRDHPRRARRRRRRARHGLDVGHPRRRRRARHRPRRPDPRPPLLPLAVLDPARRRRRRARSRRSVVVPDRRAERSGGVSWPAALLLAGWLVCLLARRQRGAGVGLGVGAGDRAVRRRRSCSRSPGSTPSSARATPLVDLQHAARAAACGRRTSPRSSWAGACTAVRADPRARRGADQRRAASARRSPRPASTSCRGRPPSRSRARLSGRLSAHFGSRVPLIIGAATGTAGFVWLIVQHGTRGRSSWRRPLLGAGTGFAFAVDGEPRDRERPARADGHRDGHARPHADARRRGRHPGRREHPLLLRRAGGLPTERGYEIAFVIGDDRARALDGGGTRRAARQPARGAADPARLLLQKGPVMQQVRLGSSGLHVSRVCLGMMSYGSSAWRPWVLDEDTRGADRARRGRGRHHVLRHGRHLLRRRQRGRHGTAPAAAPVARRARRRDQALQPDDARARTAAASRASTSSPAIDASLARLGMDYVDLYQIHRFDPLTPVEETMEALHDVVRAGKARYIGASSMFAWQFAKLQHAAERHGWTRVRLDAEPLQPALPRGGAGDDPALPRPGRRHRAVEPARARPARRQAHGARASAASVRAETDAFQDELYGRPEDFDVIDRVAEVVAPRAACRRPRSRSRGCCTSPPSCRSSAPRARATSPTRAAAAELSLSRRGDREPRGALRAERRAGPRLTPSPWRAHSTRIDMLSYQTPRV